MKGLLNFMTHKAVIFVRDPIDNLLNMHGLFKIEAEFMVLECRHINDILKIFHFIKILYFYLGHWADKLDFNEQIM